jgi:uncharacterized membrane protein YfcA
MLFAFGPPVTLGFLWGIVIFIFGMFGVPPSEVHLVPHIRYPVYVMIALSPFVFGLTGFWLALSGKLPGTKKAKSFI